MKNSALFTLLKNFSKAEFKEFGKFIRSPYHNNRSELVRYYQKLSKIYPEFNSSKMKESFFSDIYPGKKIKPVDIDRLNSYMLALCKDFLAVSALKADTVMDKVYTMKGMIDRVPESLFLKEYNNAVRTLEEMKYDERWFYLRTLIEFELINFYLGKNQQNKICENVIKRSEYYVIDVIYKLWHNFRDLFANNFSFGVEYQNSIFYGFISSIDFEKFAKALQNEKSEASAFLRFYAVSFINILSKKDSFDYSGLKKHILDSLDNISNEEKKSRLIFLHDILMMKQVNRYTQTKEIYEIEKYLFAEKIIDLSVIDKFETFTFFRNHFLDIAVFREHVYGSEFIKKFSQYLPDTHSEDTINFCRAIVAFSAGNYDEAKSFLHRVKFSFPLFKYDVRILYIKIYFENNEIEAFYSICESFKKLLDNDKKMFNERKAVYKNFIENALLVMKAKLANNISEAQHLFDKFEKDENIYPNFKIWLCEAANSIK